VRVISIKAFDRDKAWVLSDIVFLALVAIVVLWVWFSGSVTSLVNCAFRQASGITGIERGAGPIQSCISCFMLWVRLMVVFPALVFVVFKRHRATENTSPFLDKCKRHRRHQLKPPWFFSLGFCAGVVDEFRCTRAMFWPFLRTACGSLG